MRKILCILLVVFILLSLPGCMIDSYEDTNGETDFSLQTITDKDITHSSTNTTILSSVTKTHNKAICKAHTMSGVATFYEERMVNQTLDITVSCEITKGNARLVLVIDNEIVHDFAVNEDNQHLVLENVSGTVRLKLAGESAGYALTYELYA